MQPPQNNQQIRLESSFEINQPLLNRDDETGSSLNASFRVRATFWQALTELLLKSKFSVFIKILISWTKIFAILWIFHCEEPCRGPVLLWLVLMVAHDIINANAQSVYLYVLFKRDRIRRAARWNRTNILPSQNIEVNQEFQGGGIHLNNPMLNQEMSPPRSLYKLAKNFLELCSLLYLVLFIYGNVVFFSDTICTQDKTPQYFLLSLVVLVMGFITYFVPIVVGIGLCLCLPVLIFAYLFVNQSNQRPAREDLISALDIINYNSKDFVESNKECCICLVEYKTGADDLIVLPCNKSHHFHAECIRKWLLINGVCPICRKAIEPS